MSRSPLTSNRAAEGTERRYVWGINPVLEALRAHPDKVEHLYVTKGQVPEKAASEIFSRAKEARVRITQVPRERLSQMAPGVHQGVVAELKTFEYAALEDILDAAKASGQAPLVVLLDGIEDPQNLGAIIRSAHALGAHGVVIPKDRAAGVTGAVAKASAGAIEHCLLARVVNLSRALEQLKEAGLWSAALVPGAELSLPKARLDGPTALVIGAEGGGVREGVLKHCDFQVSIPMAGRLGSLNASVSAALALYEVARQRA